MDLGVLIKTIYENEDEEIRLELIQDLKNEAENHQQLIVSELRRVYIMLATTLAEAKTLELIKLIHSTLDTLTRTLLQSELELNFGGVLKVLVKGLGNADKAVRQSTKKVIEFFLKRTHNIEMVIGGLLSVGFDSTNSFLRAKSIGASVRFLDICPSVFSQRSGLNDVRRLLEGIIVRLNDSVENVRLRASRTLFKIVKERNYEDFSNVQRRLSREHVEIMLAAVNRQVLEEQDFKMKALYEKFGEIHLELFEDYSTDFIVEDTAGIRKYYLYQEIPQFSKNQILKFFPIGQSELYFNIIREDTLLDCFNQADSRVQIQGAKEVLEAFAAGESPLESIEDVRPHMGAFFKFVCFLLSSKNLTVASHAMSIIQILIQHSAGVQMKAFLILALPPLIGKLAEERVNIREQAFFLLKQITDSVKKHTLLKSLCLFLVDQRSNQKNANWHVKEELLNLISFLFLRLFDGKEAWYEDSFLTELQGENPLHVRPIDLKETIIQVALFLDDRVMKVRRAAMEALAVICSQGTHKDVLLQILHENLDSKVYDELLDKLQSGKLYFINPNGMLELPLIEVRKHQGEKDKYEERLKRYKDMLGEKDEDDLTDRLEESQKGEDDESGIDFKRRGESQKEIDARNRKLKITYYNLDNEENRLLSMNERIRLTNANIDKYLHNHEHEGVDSVKYDILVPIKDIPVNQIRILTAQAKVNTKPILENNSQQNKGNNDEIQEPLENQKEEEEEIFDPFQGDPFGKQVFVGDEENARIEKRDKEIAKKEELKKNLYLFQPLPPPPQPQEPSDDADSLDGLRMVEFEYRTDDYDPLVLASKPKLKNQRVNIQARVNETLAKLNSGANAPEKFVLNLPKVIQYNQRDYQTYSYDQKNEAGQQKEPEDQDKLEGNSGDKKQQKQANQEYESNNHNEGGEWEIEIE